MFFNCSPLNIQRRANALKRLQLEYFNIEAMFYKEMHELEVKYAAVYRNIFNKVILQFNLTFYI